MGIRTAEKVAWITFSNNYNLLPVAQIRFCAAETVVPRSTWLPPSAKWKEATNATPTMYLFAAQPFGQVVSAASNQGVDLSGGCTED